jgi:hypothetical protein
LKTGDGILRPGGPVAISSVPWFLDAMGWFPSTAGSAPGKTGVEPGILMKNKQVSEESKRCSGPFQKTKCLILNRLSISIVGYHEAEK